jgi:uncharacterized protein YodC (DUF2158 family)
MEGPLSIDEGYVMPKTISDTFEVGATVALKSGGPALTVLGQAGDRVHCVFFSDELGEFKEAMLPVVALVPAEMGDHEDDQSDDEEEASEEDNS